METDRLQGIIVKSKAQMLDKTGTDDKKFVKKYFHRIVGYASPGTKEVRNIEKRYVSLQADCDKLIARDLFERLNIPSDKIDIMR